MKDFLRKILPISIWNVLKLIKAKLIKAKVRAKIFLHMPLKKKHEKLGFRFHVIEHCNLNCYGCNNFSPIAEPEFADVDELRRDFSRLAEIFGNRCSYVWLSGGEPLLHPEIKAIIKAARDNFPSCEIAVFSNGLLLSQQSDDFWKACHDSRVDIISSAYPMNINVDVVRAKAKEHGVNFDWAYNEEESQHDTFLIEPINLAGNSNIKFNFARCGRANNCITLRKGRLFTCTFAPHVRHFNKYFKQNINITEADSVNIYDDITADEILRRMAEPIPACRYCNLDGRSVKWGISQKNINEWT